MKQRDGNATRIEIVVVVATLVGAAALRLYRLDDMPPGVVYDVAANVVDALAIVGGERPIFVAGNFGREPLFHYLLALSFSTFGTSLFTLRLVGAVVGIATVLATYLLTRELVGRSPAAIAAALLAGSYWHVSLSRLGLRAVTTPLCGALAFWLLWSGWRRGSMLRMAVGGTVLGLGIYTYIPARIYPFLAIALAVGAIVVTRRRGTITRRGILALSLAVDCFVVVAAPIGWYFAHHPDDFFGRINAATVQIGFGDGALVDLAWNALRTVGLFVVAGDWNPHHNLPGRPAFDPITGTLFVIGLIVAIRRIAIPAHAMLLAWLVLLLLPGALSQEAPHYLRNAGAIPAAYALAGIGGASAWREASRAARDETTMGILRGLLRPAVVAVVIAGSILTANDYFGRWGPSAVAYRATAGDALDAARLLLAAPADDEKLLGVGTYRGRSAQSLLIGADQHTRAFDATRTIVVPTDAEGPVWYGVVVGRDDPRDHYRHIRRLLEVGTVVDRRYDPSGREAALLVRVEPAAIGDLAPERPLVATIGGAVEVIGYDLPRRVRPGETLSLALHWRPIAALDPDRFWQFFAQVPYEGRAWASDYHEGFEPGQWRLGDRVVSWFEIRIPDALPEGTYRIELGLFDRTSGGRLGVVDGQGTSIGNVLLLGPFRVAKSDAAMPTPREAVDYELGDAIRLVGYDLASRRVARGDRIPLVLYWTTDASLPTSYSVFTHLVGPDLRPVAQHDGVPGRGELPTTLWEPGEIVRDEYEIVIPPDVREGEYPLLVGMYQLEAGERLPVRTGSGDAVGDAVRLTTIQVVP